MLRQYEVVPKQYVLEGSPDSAPSLRLNSIDKELSDSCQFQFETINPNVFRTTFTSPRHPLPPFPSVKRPEPCFGNVKPIVTNGAGQNQKEINMGNIKAIVEWDEAPVISLFVGDANKPLHRDLDFRSYALDTTGIAHYLKWNKGTLHVGLGEKAAPMNLDGRGFNITASDTFGYDAYNTDPLYKHIPLLINITPQGVVAIFSTSHARSTWSIGSEIDGMWGHFKAHRQAHGGLEEYLIVGRDITEVNLAYAELVGYPKLMPRYMMGYVSGGMKYSMTDDPPGVESVLGFLDNCNKHGMPCTAHQMSSGYTVAEKTPKTRNVFTWNRHRFPDPEAYTKECHKRGVKILANVKPYVLATHPDYQKLAESGAFFKDPISGKAATCRLWSAGGGESGIGSHLDFTSRAGYDWWYNGILDLKKVGIDVAWNDNNEYNIPNDDWQCALETVGVPPGLRRNDVGLWGRALNTELMGRSSFEATVAGEQGARPFVLTRSATAGTMKYCASSWSGDNVTSWKGMKGANSLALNAAFSLIHSYGHDIGGFEGPQPTPEHLTRWIQLGVHSPRFVINCYKTSPQDNLIGDVIEPWQYPVSTPAIRAAITRRYELVPYTYSLALRSHRTAYPPQRWTGWDYEADPCVWEPEIKDGETQYWFGDALLVAGVYEPGVTTGKIYCPDKSGTGLDPGFLNVNAPYEYLEAGKWHGVESNWYGHIPVLARIGSAVPVGKGHPTRTKEDRGQGEAEEGNEMDYDDWRGVEVFPPPLKRLPHLPAGADSASQTGELKQFGEGVVYENWWMEDDGCTPEETTEVVKITLTYKVFKSRIAVKASMSNEGGYEPIWKRNGLNIVLPVGEERPVEMDGGGMLLTRLEDRDEKGRNVWNLKF